MNKVHPYRLMEREYVSGDMSLRELCRRHGISSHSLVVIQAQQGKWQQKREKYRAKASDAFMSRHAERMADRQAEIYDKALEAIDGALSKFREDMKATKSVKQPDASIREEPVMRLMPKDVALLLDRFHVLFDRPSEITQRQGLGISAEFTPDALREFIEATRGMGGPSRVDVSPLPRARRLDD